jgi:4-hydroxy-tetrahydrodipicolinate synthase
MSTASQRLRGLFPVLVTPFDDTLAVISRDLARQTEWAVSCGVDGLVYPGVISEFFTLTDDERRANLRTVIEAAGDAVPIVAGVSGTSAPVAAEFARDAQEAGASAVMAMTPYVTHFFPPTTAYALEYYQAIAAASSLPIVLQNARMGYPLSAGAVHEIVTSVPAVRWVKEEHFPSTHTLGAAIDELGNSVDGVFAGLGGIYLLQELARGATGSMPSPMIIDLLVREYRLWTSGEFGRAREIATSLSDFFTLELLYNVSFVKEVMKRRAVISCARTRVAAPLMDEIDSSEIGILVGRLAAMAQSSGVSAASV